MSRRPYATDIHSSFALVLASLTGLITTEARAVDYDLFILSGQSNAVGFETNMSDLPPHPADTNIAFFFDVGDPPFDDGVHDSSSISIPTSMEGWTTLASQPKGNPCVSVSPPDCPPARQYGNFANPTGGFGPEMSLARDFYDGGITNIAIFKFAYSGTAFARADWHKAGFALVPRTSTS